MAQNPYEAPDTAGLPKRRPGSLDPLQRFGVLVLAVVVVVAFLLFKAGLDTINSWLFPPLEFSIPPEMRQ